MEEDTTAFAKHSRTDGEGWRDGISCRIEPAADDVRSAGAASPEQQGVAVRVADSHEEVAIVLDVAGARLVPGRIESADDDIAGRAGRAELRRHHDAVGPGPEHRRTRLVVADGLMLLQRSVGEPVAQRWEWRTAVRVRPIDALPPGSLREHRRRIDVPDVFASRRVQLPAQAHRRLGSVVGDEVALLVGAGGVALHGAEGRRRDVEAEGVADGVGDDSVAVGGADGDPRYDGD